MAKDRIRKIAFLLAFLLAAVTILGAAAADEPATGGEPSQDGGGETPGTPVPPEEVVKAFKSLKAVREASVSQLELVVPKNTARAVYEYFHAEQEESPCASSPALPEAED